VRDLVQLTIPEALKGFLNEQEVPQIIGELPPEISREVVNQVLLSAENATKISSTIIRYRERIRKIMQRQKLLNQFHEDSAIKLFNIAAVDGTYKVISTTMYDIIFVGTAAFSFRPDGFHYEVYTLLTPPSILSEKIARGTMMLLEFKMASELLKDYEFIILDGSYIANLTNIGELIAARVQHPDDPVWESDELMEMLKRLAKRRIISKLLKIPKAIAAPKKQTGKLLMREYLDGLNINATDAAVLSLVLEQKEWIKISWLGRQFLLASKFYNSDITPIDADFVERYINEVGLDIIYFKPREWTKAYKVAVPGRVGKNQLQKILNLIYHQTDNPMIEELEFQYLAHKICSQLAKVALILFTSTKNVLQQKFARKWVNMIFTATRNRTS